MFQNFILQIIVSILKDLQSSQDLPEIFQEYFRNNSTSTFFKDLKLVTLYLTNPKEIHANKLLEAILIYLTTSLTQALYTDQSAPSAAIETLLQDYTYQEIVNSLQFLMQQINKSPIVTVQTATEIDPQTKLEIQSKINQDTLSPVLPLFSVNRQLIGGLRIFFNGEVKDFSWASKINSITSL